jgi:alkylresorcinol/alkylpyrone synthase
MAHISAVEVSLPPNSYSQEHITAQLVERLSRDQATKTVIERVHQATGVATRHLALPLKDYLTVDSFTTANELYAKHALPLIVSAAAAALNTAGLGPEDVDMVFFTTVTGLGAPSLDVPLHKTLGLRSDVKRIPSFGLGCVAGASGLARVADYLAGHPDGVALVVCVELCSLTIQWGDASMANIVGTGLFGDGAAVAVMVGVDHPRARGPRVIGSQSSLYPDSEEMIGWRIGSTGFRLMLQAGVPSMIDGNFGSDVDKFLARLGKTTADIEVWLAHPGGPRILESFSEALNLRPGDLSTSWDVMASVGNLSSAGVLHVLARNMEQPRGSLGLLFALGPGISSELVALEWTR